MCRRADEWLPAGAAARRRSSTGALLVGVASARQHGLGFGRRANRNRQASSTVLTSLSPLGLPPAACGRADVWDAVADELVVVAEPGLDDGALGDVAERPADMAVVAIDDDDADADADEVVKGLLDRELAVGGSESPGDRVALEVRALGDVFVMVVGPLRDAPDQATAAQDPERVRVAAAPEQHGGFGAQDGAAPPHLREAGLQGRTRRWPARCPSS
jgi:hypothetical protein